ncbi:DUF4349 domain-containing protein [Allosphingosinicella sp.]|jgi:hypothetical protein|uniref:DUF4349 domain-containing protein n=1 Tax=Allosphingosinicella sp. TaxID=2823234 RepID=UPI002EDD3ADD
MRRSPVLLALLLAASCGQREQGGDPPKQYSPASPDSNASSETADRIAPPSPDSAGPDVGPTAAPGVAFNYRYAFRLPSERVAGMIEHHARMCEQLGINRCRIVGLNYRYVNESDIEGRLAFKLEPGIARRFGQQGVEAVTASEGMLVESEISGTDVAPAIRAAGRSIAELNEELRGIEARLARPGVKADERAQLEYEAERLRASIRASRDTREEAQESLATTPLVFQYGSGDLVPGSDTRRPLGDAFERAWTNFIEGVAILFVILVTILPWLLMALLLWLGWRWMRRRGWFAGRPEEDPPAAA